ncbi:MAG: hypothetical protein IAE91_09900 [Ignavibacteriaceae bacterium]|nr:hypothetical protein [Ignavibacteriaceae bacterium]
MYTNKDDKNIFIMVIVIFVVSIIALIAIGNIIWRIISPGVNIAVTEISNYIRINRLDYNFEIPEKKEPVVNSSANNEELTAEQQAIINLDLNYNFEVASTPEEVEGSTNFFEEIYSDYKLGPRRIVEESNKNLVLTIPKIKINSPVYQTPESSLALKFGFWLHSSSYKFNEGELVLLCTRRYFDSTDPRSCYYIDRLRVNDELSVEFKGERAYYKITEIKKIYSNFEDIYNNISSDANRLIIVSTAEIDSGRGRLVILANRV